MNARVSPIRIILLLATLAIITVVGISFRHDPGWSLFVGLVSSLMSAFLIRCPTWGELMKEDDR